MASKEALVSRLKDNAWIVGILHNVPFYALFYGFRRKTIHPIWCGITFGILGWIPLIILAAGLTEYEADGVTKIEKEPTPIETVLVLTTLAIGVASPTAGAVYGVKAAKKTALFKLDEMEVLN